MRVSLPGSVGCPGSVNSSRLPLPLESRTNGAQPIAFWESAVSSNTRVLTQPATRSCSAEPQRVVGVVAKLRMVRTEASIDKCIFPRLRIKDVDLRFASFERNIVAY